MNEDNLRKLCANEAMKYIKNNTIIGLGAGRNIAGLVELISQSKEIKIKVVTPSENTRELCINRGIEVLPTCFASEIDVAFDGCGEVDENFYASKSAGGVFVKEKIIASMAKDYILLIDEKKLVKEFSKDYPISVEVVKDSLNYALKMIKGLGANPKVRVSSNRDGNVITDDGNFLIDILFENIEDAVKLNNDLNDITGVIGTSLFTREVTKIIVAGKDGIRVIDR